jgi:hypothetical protein
VIGVPDIRAKVSDAPNTRRQRRALGLWCSILASGTWIFPINAMSPLLATSVSIPATQDDGDNVWAESEVASSWAIATGIPYVPSAQVLTLGPGPDGFPTPIEQVNAATGVGVSIGFFVVDDAILVVDQSDSIGDVSVHGCPPKPLGSNGGTKVPVLLEAETLERVGGEL